MPEYWCVKTCFVEYTYFFSFFKHYFCRVMNSYVIVNVILTESYMEKKKVFKTIIIFLTANQNAGCVLLLQLGTATYNILFLLTSLNARNKFFFSTFPSLIQ